VAARVIWSQRHGTGGGPGFSVCLSMQSLPLVSPACAPRPAAGFVDVGQPASLADVRAAVVEAGVEGVPSRWRFVVGGTTTQGGSVHMTLNPAQVCGGCGRGGAAGPVRNAVPLIIPSRNCARCRQALRLSRGRGLVGRGDAGLPSGCWLHLFCTLCAREWWGHPHHPSSMCIRSDALAAVAGLRWPRICMGARRWTRTLKP
jgi:hypothetical protein